MFPRFTSGQTPKLSTCNSFSIFYGSSMLNSLTRFLCSSLRFSVRSADDKIVSRSISAAEYASATSSILLYPLTEIPLTVNLLSYLHSTEIVILLFPLGHNFCPKNLHQLQYFKVSL